MPTPKYFLSYSREDITEIRIIGQTLMIHGIEVWQDISSLGAGISESKIRQAIQGDVDGLVLLATQQSVQSIFIRSVELPEAEKRFKQDSSFQIVPVFGLPIDSTTKALSGCLTVPISNFNGAIIKSVELQSDVILAAQRVAEIILEDTSFNGSNPLCIGISSKQTISEDVSLHLNFMSFFEDGPPETNIWDEQFLAALTEVKSQLVKKNKLSLRISAFCHLSLGILFGYVFRKTTGTRLEINQFSNNKRAIWMTDANPKDNPLTMNDLPGSLESRDLCIKINLMSADHQSVSRYVHENDITFRAVLECVPPTYPCLISGEEAVTIAAELADKIKQLHAQYDTDTVHLFAAVPLGLALFIGYNLNACGTIQCYEFDNSKRVYTPSCNLQGL